MITTAFYDGILTEKAQHHQHYSSSHEVSDFFHQQKFWQYSVALTNVIEGLISDQLHL